MRNAGNLSARGVRERVTLHLNTFVTKGLFALKQRSLQARVPTFHLLQKAWLDIFFRLKPIRMPLKNVQIATALFVKNNSFSFQ